MRKLVLMGAAVFSLSAFTAAYAQDMSVEPSANELNGQSAPAPANTVVTHDPSTGAPDAVITNYPGNMVTTPPMDMRKDYPVCTAKMQDNCQNQGEGGAPGKSRALKYWPGKPASER